MTYRKYAVAFSLAITALVPAVRQWDWSVINTTNIVFPKDFMFGVAIAEYQNSGAENGPNSNWARWETLPGTIKDGQRSGKSCDFWNKYNEDVDLVKDLGCTGCRFSVDWSMVEPANGVWDTKALQHYVDVCDAMNKKGVKPVVTLHHFVHPLWFEELNAFEKEQNIFYFVRFSKKVFETLGDRVALWCTINEPTVSTLQGYIRGAFPPGKSFAFREGANVLKNLLKAHCQVYTALKAMPGGKEAQIGLVHQSLSMFPYHESPLCPITMVEQLICGLYPRINALNSAVLEFLKTGHYRFAFGLPQLALGSWHAPKPGKDYCDFIGINYYSRVIINILDPMQRCLDGEIMTDMQYALYPQGIYETIQEFAQIAPNTPLYITENGIADADASDTRRAQYIEQYLWSVAKQLMTAAMSVDILLDAYG